MRFKVSLINYLGNHKAENVFANNKKEEKSNLQVFNLNSTVLEATLAYK